MDGGSASVKALPVGHALVGRQQIVVGGPPPVAQVKVEQAATELRHHPPHGQGKRCRATTPYEEVVSFVAPLPVRSAICHEPPTVDDAGHDGKVSSQFFRFPAK